MKIMSFNLKDSIFDNLTFRWLYRYRKILKYILDVNPDIIGTQELTHSGRRYLMKRLTNYNIIVYLMIEIDRVLGGNLIIFLEFV